MNDTRGALPPLTCDVFFPRLKDFLIESSGLAYYADKDEQLAGHIQQRLSKLGIRDCASYLGFLTDGPAGEIERDALIADLTIGETYFFRYQEQFDALRDVVLPDLIRRNQPSRRLRIWSAGCATGAEAYSLSILLKREHSLRIAGWEVTILGTDINQKFLARAREGRFDEWAFRSTPEGFRQSCFSRSGKTWVISPVYKDWVSFQYHNLVKHAFPSLLNNLSAFDLILCRNVMIYFSPEIARKIIGQFHQTLVEGGWLLVGHADANVECFRFFRMVNVPGATLYQKTEEQPPSTEILPIHVQVEKLLSPVLSQAPAPLPPLPEPAAFLNVAYGHNQPGRGGVSPPQESETLPLPGNPPSVRPRRTPRGEAITLDSNAAGPQLNRGGPPTGGQTPDPHRSGSLQTPDPPDSGESGYDNGLSEARLLADQGHWEDAAQCCRKLLERDRLNPGVYFYHALVLDQMGRAEETERSLRQAIYLDRNFVLAHYHLGLHLQKKGDAQQAAKTFKNVLELLLRMKAEQTFEDGDGITVGELRNLAEMQLEVLNG